MIASQDAIMNGVASPPYIGQHIRLPNHDMFPRVIGPYRFVSIPKMMNGFLTILLLSLNPLQFAIELLRKVMPIIEISLIFSFNFASALKFYYISPNALV